LAQRYVQEIEAPSLAEKARALLPLLKGPAGLHAVRLLYYESKVRQQALQRIGMFDFEALRLAIQDLTETFPKAYAKGPEYLRRLTELERRVADSSRADEENGDALAKAGAELISLRREALRANPLLGFGKLLVVKRRPFKGGRPGDPGAIGWAMGLPRSSAGNAALPRNAYDNEIAVLSPARPDGTLTTLYRPPERRFVGDVDLHFGGERLLFSMRDERGRWQVHEVRVDGSGFRQVTRGDPADVDSYDACYLPDGGILFCGSAVFQCVPCNGSDVAVLYRMDADGAHVRQLCFEQDHDFNPCVMPSGRVLYLRWEYSGLPHSNSRILFSMNPDGTNQAEYYGSNSYWPNGVFGARPIPDTSGKVIGIVAGHHGSYREGELVILDPQKARSEADGAAQRIPGRGKPVRPVIADDLTAKSWPKFAHPYPLSDPTTGRGAGKYFLVSCKVDPKTPWQIYLADVFDNLLLLHDAEGYGLFEPIPLRATPQPPALPTRVDLSRSDGVVFLMDIHRGGGLRGIPRGTVKRLRLFTYHFAYQGRGGLLGTVGLDGPWDIKQMLGTVPVELDGSAYFRVPANTPISVQPLDAEGKALQLMRSWFVAMPGERVSCVGCHERQADPALNTDAQALRREPSTIRPWPGPRRGFSYTREVQPVVDHYCIGCHDGRGASPNLRGDVLAADFRQTCPGHSGGVGGRAFSVGYVELSRYIRRPGIESDIHLLTPMEFHADTTQLVQLLTKGHHSVELDGESWERMLTWIDLNAPYHGTWTEAGIKLGEQPRRRRELRMRFAGVDEDPEQYVGAKARELRGTFVAPRIEEQRGTQDRPLCPDWPFDAAAARRRQAAVGLPATRTVKLGEGVQMLLVLVPPGEFIMGDEHGCPDERPLSRIRIDRPFWLGACEVSNEQYARFDPSHDSRVESKHGYQFGVHGYPVNQPRQPVVRVSWHQAMAFCRWLAQKTGEPFALPTEAQWEWACRAGSADAFSFGSVDTDYSTHANMADRKLRGFASNPYRLYDPLPRPTKYDDWIPRDDRFNDGHLVSAPVGSYRPNVWGLHDLHGNVAEWTRAVCRAYPYDPSDGRESHTAKGRRVARGGSWRDRSQRCRSAFRLAYQPYQGVYNVGFRVVIEPGASAASDISVGE
ncbi:SUMF1/EgtB/PvdO family nonheme iron enzyme, partial [bacterium]|nr:SUMF1/EgtB/PvdO family nonheme iron enzyme [bacterium]